MAADISPGSRLLARLARFSHHAPLGRMTLAMFFLRLASDEGRTPSVYGPVLRTRWHDMTFRFCVSGYYGHYLSDFLRSYREPFSFIDIGANIGLYSLIAADSRNCRRCYAFEPNPPIFETLVENIRLNGLDNVETYNVAISESAGFLPFSTIDEHSGTGRIVDGDAEGVIMVQTVDKAVFDEIAAADPLPKVVKIDVEGHEPVVVEELLKSSIWDQVRHLYFEANDDRYDVQKLVRRLEEAGLRVMFRSTHGQDHNLMMGRASGA